METRHWPTSPISESVSPTSSGRYLFPLPLLGLSMSCCCTAFSPGTSNAIMSGSGDDFFPAPHNFWVSCSSFPHMPLSLLSSGIIFIFEEIEVIIEGFCCLPQCCEAFFCALDGFSDTLFGDGGGHFLAKAASASCATFCLATIVK